MSPAKKTLTEALVIAAALAIPVAPMYVRYHHSFRAAEATLDLANISRSALAYVEREKPAPKPEPRPPKSMLDWLRGLLA